jgi:cation-transporting ATPase E
MSIFVSLLAVATGFAYPFLPIHLTLISTLTIGVPGFFFAMEPNYARVKGHFLPTVLGRALPGGLCNGIMIFLLQQILSAKGFETGDISTLATVVLVTTGILVLVQAGTPLDWFRGIVIGAMAGAILGCFLILPDLFALHFSGRAALTWVPVVIGSTILVFTALRFLCKKVKIC